MVKFPAASAQSPRIPARKLTVTAVVMAMNSIMSISALSVPVPGGHMYLNDVIIVTAAVLLEPFYHGERHRRGRGCHVHRYQ